jgi:hypothetical protein
MAVIEYMLYKDAHKRQVPDFVGDRVRDYYVPDTIVTLTKTEFVARQLAIHASSPFTKPVGDAVGPGGERENMTTEEVTAQAEAWYDDFVAKNSA